MSVLARINQKSLFKKKLTIEEVVVQTGLSYGTFDDAYRLNPDEYGADTIVYDEESPARGLLVHTDGTNIEMQLNFPTTEHEIRLFYSTVEKLCKWLNVKKYLIEDTEVALGDSEQYIQNDINTSQYTLSMIAEKAEKGENMTIFGVNNPVTLGINEVAEINGSLENFASLMRRLMSADAFYASAKLFQLNDDRIVGVYVVGPDITSIVPETPGVLMMSSDITVSQWYMYFDSDHIVKYTDFVSFFEDRLMYDADHFVVTLTEEQIADIDSRYHTELGK